MLLWIVFYLKNPLGEQKCGWLSQADVKAELSDSRDVYASLWRTVSLISFEDWLDFGGEVWLYELF